MAVTLFTVHERYKIYLCRFEEAGETESAEVPWAILRA